MTCIYILKIHYTNIAVFLRDTKGKKIMFNYYTFVWFFQLLIFP